MKPVLAILLTAILLGACASQKETSEPVENAEWRQDTVVISFERTACFGMCPTFIAKVYGDGTVKYHGINNVENKGYFTGLMTKETMESVFQKASELGYFELKDKYDAKVTDVPSQIYFIEMHGKRKRIFARYNGPQELNEFGKYLDEMLARMDLRSVERIDH